MPGIVIRSFASPGSTPYGVAWDGRTLWHTDDVGATIYQIDPVTGRVIRSFSAPGTSPAGLAWDGRTLWLADDNDNKLYQVSV